MAYAPEPWLNPATHPAASDSLLEEFFISTSLMSPGVAFLDVIPYELFFLATSEVGFAEHILLVDLKALGAHLLLVCVKSIPWQTSTASSLI